MDTGCPSETSGRPKGGRYAIVPGMNTKLAWAIFFMIVVVGAGGYWYTTTNSAREISQQFTACADFDSFKSLALGSIGQSIPTNNLIAIATSTIDAFEWKRSTTEPFVTYPYVREVLFSTHRLGLDQNNWPPFSATSSVPLKEEASMVSILLQQNLANATEVLAMTESELNTAPLQENRCSGIGTCVEGEWVRSTQHWGFTKDSSLYSIQLYAQPNFGAGGYMEVDIGCSTPRSDYDHAYDLLLSPANKTTLSTFSGPGVLRIYKLSDDKSVVDVGLQYYSVIGNKATLVTQGSSPPLCQPFEKNKVGLGLTCDDSYTGERREVSYSGIPLTEPYTYTNTTFNYQLQVPEGFSIQREDETYVDRSFSVRINSDGTIPGAQGISVWIYKNGDPRIGELPPGISAKTINGIQWTYAINESWGDPDEKIELYWTSHGGILYLITHRIPDPAAVVAKSVIESFSLTAP